MTKEEPEGNKREKCDGNCTDCLSDSCVPYRTPAGEPPQPSTAEQLMKEWSDAVRQGYRAEALAVQYQSAAEEYTKRASLLLRKLYAALQKESQS